MRTFRFTSTPIWFHGVLLNCDDGSNFDPSLFEIRSNLENVQTGENTPVNCQITGDTLTFSSEPLLCGTYLWKTVLTMKANPARVWMAPITIIEVNYNAG